VTPKILIADDEPHIRLLLGRILEEFEDEGVELIIATDGSEALNLIETEQPVLVFLDVMMPILNGFDVCQRVKSNFGMDNIVIVMLTAKGQEIDKQRGLEVGADIYITKPFDPDDILEITNSVLSRAG
jgi:DNA-binding response OmpR family regulator